MFLREWSEYFKKVYSRNEDFKISITFSLLSSLLLNFCGLAVSTEKKKTGRDAAKELRTSWGARVIKCV